MKCDFLLLTICVFSVVSRIFPSLEPAVTYPQSAGDSPDNLRFSPTLANISVHDLVRSNWKSGWKRLYLRSASCSSFFASCLLLLSGDIEMNPGPVKYPCTVCTKVVRSDQRAISCDECDRWTHASCCGIGKDQYSHLSSMGDFQWICPSCQLKELPFRDSSLNSEISIMDLTTASENGETVMDSPFDSPSDKAILCHLNTQSVGNKLDELKLNLSKSKRPIVLGISESWLDSSSYSRWSSGYSIIHYPQT